MNKFQRYLHIVRLIRAGRADKLKKDDYLFFRQFSLDPAAINEFKASQEFKSLPEDEKKLTEANLAAFQTPEFKNEVLLMGEDVEKAELANKLTQAVNIALSGADILTSGQQIRAANEAQRRIRRPQSPAPLTADPLLQRALADADRGNLDAARALSPAQLQILDQYLSDINTARSVSGGQAGLYGALAQTASTRRGRRSLELAPLYDTIQRRGEARYDQLLAQKLAENRAIQESQAQTYPYDLQQYNNELVAAGNLGVLGRQNLRSSVGAFASYLPALASRFAVKKKYGDVFNANVGYGPENARIMAEAAVDHDSGYDDNYIQYLQEIYNSN